LPLLDRRYGNWAALLKIVNKVSIVLSAVKDSGSGRPFTPCVDDASLRHHRNTTDVHNFLNDGERYSEMLTINMVLTPGAIAAHDSGFTNFSSGISLNPNFNRRLFNLVSANQLHSSKFSENRSPN
jgi:hypothetical protein